MNRPPKISSMKKAASSLIAFCMTLCLMPKEDVFYAHAAVTNYNITVNGIAVTSKNASDILGKGKKEIVFEEPSKLMINKDITLSSPIICNTGVNIVITDDITINSSQPIDCFELHQPSFIKGGKKLTVNCIGIVTAYSNLVFSDIDITATGSADGFISYGNISSFGDSVLFQNTNLKGNHINIVSSEKSEKDTDISIFNSKLSLGKGDVSTKGDIFLKNSQMNCQTIHGNSNNSSADHKSVFEVNDSNISTSGPISYFRGGYTFSGCAVNSPIKHNIDEKTGSILDYDNKTPDSILIGKDESGSYDVYDLYIKGAFATSKNSKDILGDGVFSYDNESKTLTVKGDCSFNEKNLISHIDGLTINIAEDSDFKGTDTGASIICYEPTTITGKGKLRMIKGASTDIYSRKMLTITDADIEILRNTEYSGLGIYSLNDPSVLIINNSKIKTDTSIWGFNEIQINDSDIDLDSGWIYPFEMPGYGDPLDTYRESENHKFFITNSNLKCGSVRYFKGGIYLKDCEAVKPEYVQYNKDNGSLCHSDGKITDELIIAAVTTTSSTVSSTTSQTTATTSKPTATTSKTTATTSKTTATTSKPTATTSKTTATTSKTTATTSKPTATTSKTTATSSKSTTTSSKSSTVTLYGDTNGDKSVDLSDAVLIMQSIANPDKFGINGTDKAHITEIGSINGDVSGNGDGITSRDALAIQKFKLKLIDSLPEKDNSDK